MGLSVMFVFFARGSKEAGGGGGGGNKKIKERSSRNRKEENECEKAVWKLGCGARAKKQGAGEVHEEARQRTHDKCVRGHGL